MLETQIMLLCYKVHWVCYSTLEHMQWSRNRGGWGGGGGTAPPNIRFHVIVYIILCIIWLCWFYYSLLFWSTPPNTPWSPQYKTGSYSTDITWEVTTVFETPLNIVSYPDMSRSHLSMPGYEDPITTRGVSCMRAYCRTQSKDSLSTDSKRLV